MVKLCLCRQLLQLCHAEALAGCCKACSLRRPGVLNGDKGLLQCRHSQGLQSSHCIQT